MRIPIALALLLAAAAEAGSVNLVNLVKRDTTRFTFTQGDAKETFELPAGKLQREVPVRLRHCDPLHRGARCRDDGRRERR